MASFKEIVTKAVVGKGKKFFKNSYTVKCDNSPTTVLGCWVINHKFKGYKSGDKIGVDGSFDINIWYSYDNDTKTDVVKETNRYSETVHMRNVETDTTNEEIIVRSLKQPNCIKAEINGNKIDYSVEKELGIELVGDVKVKIEANLEEDPWEEILEENKVDDVIDSEVREEYIEDK